MSKDKQVQQDIQSKTRVNKPVQEEERHAETAVSNPIPSLQRAYTDPRTLSSTDAKILQRTIGNQALGRLTIQRKMTVGPVGDKYEQEADAVAKQVVSTLHAPPTHNPQAETAQRQEEEELQMKPEGSGLMPSISRLQRQEEEELQMKPQIIQRNSAAGFETDATFETSLNSQKGNGSPLPAKLRADFEPKFGADFSGVRVHNNEQSHKLNQSIQAKAFTTGQDLFFRQGEYEPESRGGQQLIAHELTHVVQQSTQSVKRAPHNTVQRLIDGFYDDGSKKVPKQRISLTKDFKQKHVANDTNEARQITGRRIDNPTTKPKAPASMVNGQLSNTTASEQNWITAIDNSIAVIPDQDNWSGNMAIEITGWDAKRTGPRNISVSAIAGENRTIGGYMNKQGGSVEIDHVAGA